MKKLAKKIFYGGKNMTITTKKLDFFQIAELELYTNKFSRLLGRFWWLDGVIYRHLANRSKKKWLKYQIIKGLSEESVKADDVNEFLEIVVSDN